MESHGAVKFHHADTWQQPPLKRVEVQCASQNNAYGDDFQDATNYPIVRFTNVATGHIFYGRTHDHSTMAVGYTGPTYTHLDVPSNMEAGGTNLQVIVNGIASQNYFIGIR